MAKPGLDYVRVDLRNLIQTFISCALSRESRTTLVNVYVDLVGFTHIAGTQ